MMHYIWPADSEFGMMIARVILGLSVWAIIMAILHYKTLRDEISNITKIDNVLTSWLHPPETDNETPATRTDNKDDKGVQKLDLVALDGELHKLEQIAKENSHIHQRVVAIRRLRSRQTKINLENKGMLLLDLHSNLTFFGSAKIVSGANIQQPPSSRIVTSSWQCE